MHRRTLLKTAAFATLAAPAIAQPAKAATLRFIPQANLTSLDPIWTTATVTNNHGYYVYDTLYACGADMRPTPQMAAGHEVSPDGRVWRIHLRDGLKFHDNTPVRSIDCAVSIQRWARRDPLGQLLAQIVEQWVTSDDKVLELRLTRPFPLLLDALAKPDALVPYIMPERIARTDAMKSITEVVGSGPYRFLADEFVAGARVAYARNDAYVPRTEAPNWASGGKMAHYPRVEWNVIPDAATAALAMQRGEADWWERPLNDLLPVLAKNPALSSQISDPSGRTSVMRLNCLQAPFNDVRIRRAVLMAVNQEDYMRAANGDDPALWRVCKSLFACGTPYSDEAAGQQLMRGDAKAARAMLAEAGYAGQKVVIINPTDFPQIGQLGQVTAAMLRDIGMNVELQETDWGSVIQRRASREATDKGGWSIFHTTGSAAGWVNPAVADVVRGRGAAGWFGWWESPAAEALVQEWLAAPDITGQTKAAVALNALALRDVATVPLGQFFIRTVFNRRITGILPGPCPYPWNVRPTA